MISIKRMEYNGWKNCIHITNGSVEAIATTDIGPRIIRFGYCGGENEFFENIDDAGKANGSTWRIYGGHRLWHSPEADPRSYVPDNFTVDSDQLGNGFVLKQAVEEWTNIEKTVRFVMHDTAPQAEIIHTLANRGAWPVTLSVWAITAMAGGGVEIIPQPDNDTGLLPNRMLSLWPYTRLDDSRLRFAGKYIILRQDKLAESPIKIGLPNMDGWAAYINRNRMFMKRYVHSGEGSYPDYGSSYETYSDKNMVEMESLSPLITLGPGESAEHRETWFLHDNVGMPSGEEEITALMKACLKGKGL